MKAPKPHRTPNPRARKPRATPKPKVSIADYIYGGILLGLLAGAASIYIWY